MGEQMPWWVEYKKLICFVIILITTTISLKLIFGEVSFDFGSVSMFDMLSISIAFFAIAISFAFYFQASNTSNQFYDNTYKFTNEVSEILGRIEGAFGEKLTHLDHSYNRMDEKLDRKFNPRVAEEKLEQNEDEKESSLEEQKSLIEELVSRAQMTEVERDSFYEKWKETQERLMHASEEISVLNRRLEKYRSGSNARMVSEEERRFKLLRSRVRRIIYSRINNTPDSLDIIMSRDPSDINRWYKSVFSNEDFIANYMKVLGYQDGDDLTMSGIDEIIDVCLSKG